MLSARKEAERCRGASEGTGRPCTQTNRAPPRPPERSLRPPWLLCTYHHKCTPPPPPLLPPPYHRDQHGIEGAALTLFWVLMSPPAWMMIWAMSRQLCQAARCSAVSLRKTNPPGGGHVDQRFRATNPELNPDHQKTRQRKATATARRRQGSVCEKREEEEEENTAEICRDTGAVPPLRGPARSSTTAAGKRSHPRLARDTRHAVVSAGQRRAHPVLGS